MLVVDWLTVSQSLKMSNINAAVFSLASTVQSDPTVIIIIIIIIIFTTTTTTTNNNNNNNNNNKDCFTRVTPNSDVNH